MNRKIPIYVILTFFLLVIPSFADFGIKLGINLSYFNFSQPIEAAWDKTTNIQAGIFYKFTLSKRFELQPELYYTETGAKTSGTFWGSKINIKANLCYLKLPILLKFNILNLKNIQAGVSIGPYLASNIKSKTITSYNDNVREDDITDQIRNIDYGLVFGTYINFKNILFDIRFSSGVKKLSTEKESNFSVKNNSLVFLIGYKF
jgi:hypothetical protein